MKAQTLINSNEDLVKHINYLVSERKADAKDAAKALYKEDNELRRSMNAIWQKDLPLVYIITALVAYAQNIRGILLPIYTLFIAAYIIRDASKISNIWLKRTSSLIPFNLTKAHQSKIVKIIAADRSSKLLISKVIFIGYLPLIVIAMHWTAILPGAQWLLYKIGSLILISLFIILLCVLNNDR